MERYILSNGYKMPVMGLGTDDVFYLRKRKKLNNRFLNRALSAYYSRVLRPILNHQLSNTISDAIKMGYRLIDTSAAYFNEAPIGQAIKKSGVPREELFITTRVTNQQQYQDNVRDSFFSSLKKLDLDYIDLYQIHWPVPDHYLKTWKEIEKLYAEGLIKAIGVANCHQHHIEEILKICEYPPMVNEIEVHPLFSQKPLIQYCTEHNIRVEAYTPLARNEERLRNNRTLHALADKYHKTTMQVILRWHIENGVIPIPRSTNPDRLRQNIDLFDFSLTPEEVKSIDAININSRLRYDPDNCDFTML